MLDDMLYSCIRSFNKKGRKVKLRRKMYKLSIHPTFGRIIALFYEFIFWQNDEVFTLRNKRRKLIYLLNIILFQMLIVICARISDDKSESLFLAQVEISALVMTVKLIFLLWNKDTVLLFLSDSIVTHHISEYAVFVQVNDKLKKFMRYVHVYIATMALAATVLILSPLPIISSDKKLPLFIVYSLDWKFSELIYWIIYSLLALQIVLIFVVNLLTVIIWYVMLNCSIKYQILGEQLMNLDIKTATCVELEKMNSDIELSTVENDGMENISKVECDLFYQDLIKLAESHQNIFEYSIFDIQKIRSEE